MTSDNGGRKKKGGEPRQAELEYLLDLGEDVTGLRSQRRESTFRVPLRLGCDMGTAYGRQCRRERDHLLPWIREQRARSDAIGKLARALAAHEGSLAEEQEPPDSWVILLSRISRGELGRGKDKLRQAVDRARVEFNRTHEEKKPPAAFQEAAE